jgi:hypothetical protein
MAQKAEFTLLSGRHCMFLEQWCTNFEQVSYCWMVRQDGAAGWCGRQEFMLDVPATAE